ncbi:PDZ domain-containing protein [Parafilimonas sp.]|uniref:PDZ domain-containing protein n=1 Tax=Parafilimonas sp. TaxID=1969739 RepID=UPI0039E726FC
MIKTVRLMTLFSATLAFVSAQAQPPVKEKPDNTNRQDIIIQKKDSTKEKITVVIDGNTITVNGKPVDDFKSDDVKIIQQKIKDDKHIFVEGHRSGATAFAPATPPMLELRKEMRNSVKSNAAFLGIMSEKNDQGAKITDVTDGSAAEKAGLKEGDIITKIGDDKITSPDDLYQTVGKHKPDEKVAITYLRDGKQATANATLGKSEQMHVFSWNTPGSEGRSLKSFSGPQGFAFSWNDNKPRLGLSVQDTEEGNGVKVLDIDDEDSPAAKAGLKEDDVITQVNGKNIASTDDLRESIKELKKGDTVKITYKRNNQTQTVDVKIPKDLKTIDL